MGKKKQEEIAKALKAAGLVYLGGGKWEKPHVNPPARPKSE